MPAAPQAAAASLPAKLVGAVDGLQPLSARSGGERGMIAAWRLPCLPQEGQAGQASYSQLHQQQQLQQRQHKLRASCAGGPKGQGATCAAWVAGGCLVGRVAHSQLQHRSAALFTTRGPHPTDINGLAYFAGSSTAPAQPAQKRPPGLAAGGGKPRRTTYYQVKAFQEVRQAYHAGGFGPLWRLG